MINSEWHSQQNLIPIFTQNQWRDNAGITVSVCQMRDQRLSFAFVSIVGKLLQWEIFNMRNYWDKRVFIILLSVRCGLAVGRWVLLHAFRDPSSFCLTDGLHFPRPWGPLPSLCVSNRWRKKQCVGIPRQVLMLQTWQQKTGLCSKSVSQNSGT